MTDQQSTQITNMRESGLGYSTIASQIGLSKDCVRSYCRTHGLKGIRSPSHVDKEVGNNTCRTCGRYLQHTPGKRKKQYCSDACRMDWWNAHQDKVKRKAYYSFTCANVVRPSAHTEMQKESTAAILAISRLVFPRGKSSSDPELRLRTRTLNQLPGISLKLSKEYYSLESCLAGFYRPIFLITPSNYHTK